MSTVLAIARRELDQYFATPMGWIFLCGFVFVTGGYFTAVTSWYGKQALEAAFSPYGGGGVDIHDTIVPELFGFMTTILMLLVPAIAMRLFSEDRRQRSFELLLSSPITSTQIVLGKYLGALGFVAVLLASTVHYVIILDWLSTPDWGVVLSNYLSLLLVCGVFLAVGMLMSTVTENQIVAFGLGFGLVLILWILSILQALTDASWATALSYVSFLPHNEQLSKGVLHVEDVVYFVTFIGFFLFATHQRVEAYRWQ